MRAIIHADMDAFYAAVEQLDAPELRGRPVIVGGLGRRGVVSTASYEARVYGVRSAMPTAQALRLCPASVGVYVEPRMSRYAEVSREVFAVFAETTPEVEGLSLDEAFLDVTASLRLLGDIETIARWIKDEVRRRTGLAVSVGMAHNKLLAKLASELGKPDGFYRIAPDRIEAMLDPLPVTRLWTVGKVAAEKLERYGVRTIGELRLAPLSLLERLFRSHGATLQALARGEDERPVVAEREDKSLGAETTFDVDLDTLDQAHTWLMRLTERVAERARHHGLAGRTVTLKLRVPPFETMTRQTTLAQPSAATATLHAAGKRLLEKWWHERDAPKLRLLGVTLSQLVETTAATPVAPTKEDLVLDAINDKFGTGAIRRATGLRK
ncbi:MAG TPA: DNA polymerase IV [Xanthomonadales bacterium]|nr:DNA polymerase IV [Xanthomonadales bacterium]